MRFLLIVPLFMFILGTALAAVPDNRGRITDDAGVLTTSQVQALAARMKPGEANGSQTAVLLVKTLDGQPIEEYASDVFSKWKIGYKAKEDGLLLIIATQDRKVRIHTGYGTEARITDTQTKDIIDRMKPSLSRADWNGAVSIFITESAALMKKE